MYLDLQPEVPMERGENYAALCKAEPR